MILLDTSALIFWTLDQKKLSAAAAEAIEAAEQITLSSISLWEIGIKVKKGRLEIPYAIDEYAQKLKIVQKVEILAVDEATWLKSLALDWPHRDPADRVIVATAVLHACPLITSDRTIRAFYKNALW
jgi:PIN domain nuclease of toxin-antitoxin system